MSLKDARKIQKDLKAAKKECDRLELENMVLRLDMERRTVEFMGQMQDFFGIVDSIFYDGEVGTLGEAKRDWKAFRDVLDETEDVTKALDAIGRESIATPERNAGLVVAMWGKGDAN